MIDGQLSLRTAGEAVMAITNWSIVPRGFALHGLCSEPLPSMKVAGYFFFGPRLKNYRNLFVIEGAARFNN